VPRLLRTGSGHWSILTNDKLKADTFEAVLGAVHLDCRATAGITAVPSPVLRILAKVIPGFSTTAGAAAAKVAFVAGAMANADAVPVAAVSERQ
jgi:dsRNA-specific ribonuclease